MQGHDATQRRTSMNATQRTHRTLAAVVCTLLCATLLLIAACSSTKRSAAQRDASAVQVSSTWVSVTTVSECGAPLDTLPAGYSVPVAAWRACVRYLAEQDVRVAEDEFGWDACRQGNGTGLRPDGVRCAHGVVVATTGQDYTTPVS